jgi:hypothetical protein
MKVKKAKIEQEDVFSLEYERLASLVPNREWFDWHVENMGKNIVKPTVEQMIGICRQIVVYSAIAHRKIA